MSALNLLVLLLSVNPADAASWPTFRRDQARTGFVQETVAPPYTLGWTYTIPGQVMSSPVVAQGKLFIGSRNGKVYCLDAASGNLLWSYTTSDWVDATPVYSGGKVFVPSRDGHLYALNAADGSLAWSHATGSRDIGSPLVILGEVYMATGNPNKKLLVLDAASGSLRRQAELTKFTGSSPVFDSQTGYIYIGTSDGKYQGFNFNLTPKWGDPIQTMGSLGLATPALANDGALLLAAPGDDDWWLHAYDAASGAAVWTSTHLANTASLASSVAVSTWAAYVASGYDDSGSNIPYTLYGVDLADGGILWSVPLGNALNYNIGSSPAVANDLVFIASPQGELYVVTAASGGVVARLALGGSSVSSPAIANGWVYGATVDGKVRGFQSGRTWSLSDPDPILGSAEGVISLAGTIASPALQSWKVEYGTGTSPTSWTQVAAGDSGVNGGSLGEWDTRELEDDVYTLRIVVSESPASGSYPETRARLPISQLRTTTLDGSVGATMTLSDGTEVAVPAGAINGTDTLIVKKITSDFPLDSPPNATPTHIVRQFRLASSENPQFLKPVTMKLPYYSITPTKEENLRIFFYDESALSWKMVNTSVVKKSEKRVWATIDHFTLFQLMEYMPSGALLQEAQVYTYPNPARGGTVTFKYLVADAAEIRIRVYDVSGQQVAQLNAPSNPAGIASTLDWDIGRIASGVYVYVLEATGFNGQKASVTKKLAIIH